MLVEVALESLEDVDDAGEAGSLERFAGIDRARSAAADEQHRPSPVAAQQARDAMGELRIDLPVRRLLPGDVLGTDGMTDIHELDLGAAIDQQRPGVNLEEGVGGGRIEMFHAGGCGRDRRIIRRERDWRKLGG